MDKDRRGAIKEMLKLGDIIKIRNEEEDDWGYIAKEDDKNFWIHWFVPLEEDQGGDLYKYSKQQEFWEFLKLIFLNHFNRLFYNIFL